MNRDSRHFSRGSEAAGRLWLQYILTLLGWAALVLFSIYLGRAILSQRTWYGNEPLYPLLHWMWDYVLLTCGLSVLAGWLVISYRFLARPLRYLDELTAAAEQLASPSEAPIVLPEAMSATESRLNLFREQALRAAYAAREAEQRKNDLVVYLAHDIRTPLTSVIGYLDLMKEAPDLPVEQRAKYLSITLDKAYRLEQLINEFFEITRFNLQSIPLNRENLHLSYMLQQMVEEFYPILSPAGKTAHVHVPEDLILPGDPDKLARVFNNILKNAAAYSYPDTVIEIRAWQEESQIHITFTNQGPVIPPENLRSIIEIFFRLDSARSTSTGGAGLGLASAKEIVTAHQGVISASSSEEGTVFSISLPAAE